MPEVIRDISQLKSGEMYQVHWKSQGGNYQWSEKAAIWKFIDANARTNKLLWSGRPLCGTQDMEVATFIMAISVPADTKPTLPRRIGVLKPDVR